MSVLDSGYILAYESDRIITLTLQRQEFLPSGGGNFWRMWGNKSSAVAPE